MQVDSNTNEVVATGEGEWEQVWPQPGSNDEVFDSDDFRSLVSKYPELADLPEFKQGGSFEVPQVESAVGGEFKINRVM